MFKGLSVKELVTLGRESGFTSYSAARLEPLQLKPMTLEKLISHPGNYRQTSLMVVPYI